MEFYPLFFSLLGGAVAGVIASGKNRNAVGWGMLSLVLPVIGVIVACVLTDGAKRLKTPALARGRSAPAPRGMREAGSLVAHARAH